MRVLLTGAGGFIGGGLLEALLAAGHQVRAVARDPAGLPSAAEAVRLDLRQALDPADWTPLLDGVDVVVNAAGILREQRRGDFERVHRQAPAALLAACRHRGAIKFVQISALGDPADGEFVASKHRFDDELLASGQPATVIRPSVVLSQRGSYGGSSLLRALASLPWLLPVPGDGGQPLQPVLLDDLAAQVLRCLDPGAANGRLIYSVGAEVMTLRELLLQLRRWLRWPPARCIEVPLALVRGAAWLGERLGRGPLGQTMTTMLARGNVAPAGAWQQAASATGIETRSLRAVLESSASFVQDRWHARLYFLRPLSLVILLLIWFGSALAGFAAPPAEFGPILDALQVPSALQAPLVVASSSWNLLLGLALLSGWRRGAVIALMLLSTLAYSAALGLLAPVLWLEPLGGLLKNLAVAALLLVYAVLEALR